jgi:hypothetical protein
MEPHAKRHRTSGPQKRFHVSTELRAKTCEIQWDVLNFKEIISNSATLKDKLVQEIKFRFSTTSEVLDNIIVHWIEIFNSTMQCGFCCDSFSA